MAVIGMGTTRKGFERLYAILAGADGPKARSLSHSLTQARS